MVPFRYNLRSLVVRKVTTIATAAGIALVVAVFGASLMLSDGIGRALATSGRADTAIVLRKGSDAELASAISVESVNQLRGMPQVARDGGVVAEAVIVITADLVDGSGISNVIVRGIPPDGMAFRPEARIVSGRAPKPGTNEVIVGKGISGRFKGIAPGQQFEVKRNRALVVVGEFDAGGTSYESEVWADLGTLQTYLNRQTVVQSARVRLTSADAFEPFRMAVEGDKRFSLKVTRETDYFEKQSEQTAGFLSGLGTVAAVLFSIAAMIGAAITMNGAVAHRTKEIGTLRALGFSRFSILISFLLEAVVLALVGGMIGLVIVVIASMKTVTVMNFQTFSDVAIAFRAGPNVLVPALVFSAVMGLLGGLFPAIRAARVSPVEAMRA